MNPRTILQTILAVEQAEGVGARVRRSIGVLKMRNFTPFLMLDHFKIDPSAGFPDHPHRGQETITYMIEGEVAHNDFTGAAGIIRAGDLQFMTAGRGIVHAEMPVEPVDGKPIVGMQLWVDLPELLKMCEPRYRDLRAAEIPIANPNELVQVKVILGESYGVKSVQDLAYTPVEYYHYSVKKGGSFTQAIPADFNAFLYVMSGNLSLPGTQTATEVSLYTNVFFNRDGDSITGNATEDTSFVLVAGQVLDQKIVQHGPFVETSNEKMQQAFRDYQYGENGFERARGWKSRIRGGVTEKLRLQLEAEEAEATKPQAPKAAERHDEL